MNTEPNGHEWKARAQFAEHMANTYLETIENQFREIAYLKTKETHLCEKRELQKCRQLVNEWREKYWNHIATCKDVD